MQKTDKPFYTPPLTRVRRVEFENVVCDLSQTDYGYVDLDENDNQG